MPCSASQVDDGSCFFCDSSVEVSDWVCSSCAAPPYRTALDPRTAAVETAHAGYWLLFHKSHDGIWFSWQPIDSKPRRGIGGKRDSIESAYHAALRMIHMFDQISDDVTQAANAWVL